MDPRYVWGLGFIVAGALFLLDNIGVLPGSAWGYILPLLLVLIGLSIVLGPITSTRLESMHDSLPLGQATASRLTFKHGAGRLDITSGSDPELLFSGDFRGGLDKRVLRSGDRIDVLLQPAQHRWSGRVGMPWSWWSTRGGLSWMVGLNPDHPLELVLDTGASQSHLDLSGLRVTELALNTGASSTELTLPGQAGYTHAKINSGAASVQVRVPPNVAARISGKMALGALEVDQARFPLRGSAYESQDWSEATNRVDLEIDGGVGAVRVR